MREVFKVGLVLFWVCIGSALCLSITFIFTKPHIEARRSLELKRSLKEVMPDSKGGFEEVVQDDITYYEAYRDPQRKSIYGYVVIARGKGYSGPILTMVGVDRKGVIKGIKILEQKETPGLGTKICEKDFILQFLGQNGLRLELSRNKGRDKIMAISGATKSSRAITDSVKKAVERLFKIVKNPV